MSYLKLRHQYISTYRKLHSDYMNDIYDYYYPSLKYKRIYISTHKKKIELYELNKIPIKDIVAFSRSTTIHPKHHMGEGIPVLKSTTIAWRLAIKKSTFFDRVLVGRPELKLISPSFAFRSGKLRKNSDDVKYDLLFHGFKSIRNYSYKLNYNGPMIINNHITAKSKHLYTNQYYYELLKLEKEIAKYNGEISLKLINIDNCYYNPIYFKSKEDRMAFLMLGQ